MAQRRTHVDVREVLRRAKNQGFGIKQTKNGFMLLSPAGDRYAFHPSMLDRRANRSQANVLAGLRRIGLNLDGDWRKQMVTVPKEPVTLPAHMVKEEPPTVVEEPVKEQVKPELVPVTSVQFDTWNWVRTEPGLAPREYARKYDEGQLAVVQRLRELRLKGLVRTEGMTKAARVFLVEGKQAVVAQDQAKQKAKQKAKKEPVKVKEPVKAKEPVKVEQPKEPVKAKEPVKVKEPDPALRVQRLLVDLNKLAAAITHEVAPLVEENARLHAKLDGLEEKIEAVLEAL